MGNHVVKPWAFEADHGEERDRRQARWEEIEHRRAEVVVVERSPQQGSRSWEVVWPTDMSALDIALLCDRGNTCFGGNVQGRPGGPGVCTIWTD